MKYSVVLSLLDLPLHLRLYKQKICSNALSYYHSTGKKFVPNFTNEVERKNDILRLQVCTKEVSKVK